MSPMRNYVARNILRGSPPSTYLLMSSSSDTACRSTYCLAGWLVDPPQPRRSIITEDQVEEYEER